MEISELTAMDAWKAALDHIMHHGKDFQDKDNRTCKEVLNLSVCIQHPELSVDDPIDYLQNTNKWVYPSKDELISIIFNKDLDSMYEYTYGNRIFAYDGVLDQVNNYVIPLLRSKPSSRRATIMTMNPLEDLQLTNRNAPGLVSLHFKIEEKKLLLTSIIRSNDYFIGWPANVFQLVALQKYIAEQLDLQVGSLTTYSISAHVFEEYKKDIDEALSK